MRITEGSRCSRALEGGIMGQAYFKWNSMVLNVIGRQRGRMPSVACRLPLRRLLFGLTSATAAILR